MARHPLRREEAVADEDANEDEDDEGEATATIVRLPRAEAEAPLHAIWPLCGRETERCMSL